MQQLIRIYNKKPALFQHCGQLTIFLDIIYHKTLNISLHASKPPTHQNNNANVVPYFSLPSPPLPQHKLIKIECNIIKKIYTIRLILMKLINGSTHKKNQILKFSMLLLSIKWQIYNDRTMFSGTLHFYILRCK